MKRNMHFLKSSIMAVAVVLLFAFGASAQEAFQVKWTMDYTQAGVSSHSNFAPYAAVLAGGANTFTLPTVYSGGGGAVVVGYIIRPWPVIFSAGRYVEFKFTANSFKYNISSISFRLRRSNNGPNSIKVRTSMDNFAADLNAFTISNNGVFNSYSIPVSYHNLSSNTFSLRIYAYNAVDIYGTLWFDEISVNGDVVAIVLPVDLTYFKANAGDGRVTLDWETGWEKQSREFVIERSGDMKDFAPIGSVLAAGNISSGQPRVRTAYAFTDPAPLPGRNYYRLRVTDADGSFTTCKPISVLNPETTSRICVTPNPVSGGTITIRAPGGRSAQFALHNAAGAPIPFRREDDGAGQIRLTPFHALSPGMYLILYVDEGRKEQLKVLVP